jgi:hypothetical protein
MRRQRNYTKSKLVVVAATAFLLFASIRTASHAEPITSIDGSIDFFALAVVPGPPPTSTGNLVISLNLAQSIQFNGAPIPGGPVFTIFAPILTIASSSSTGGFTNYLFDENTTPKVLLFDRDQGGGFALFNLNLTEAIVNNSAPNTILFRGTEILALDNSPLFDFSPFLAGGAINYSLTGLGNFNNILSFGGVTIGSGTFSQTVPEPSTLLLLGTGLLVMAYIGRRRLHL